MVTEIKEWSGHSRSDHEENYDDKNEARLGRGRHIKPYQIILIGHRSDFSNSLSRLKLAYFKHYSPIPFCR